MLTTEAAAAAAARARSRRERGRRCQRTASRSTSRSRWPRSASAATRSILSEAGPTLFASLVAAGLVDELFLTVSPLLAGRDDAPRRALVEGVELLPGLPRRAQVLSVRRHAEHLFLRYRLA